MPLTGRSPVLASELHHRAALSLPLYAYTGTPTQSSLSELALGWYGVSRATRTVLNHARKEDLRS
jgi:hypothetical protein